MTVAVKDYYSILGIHPSATNAEIKKAYRRLAQQLHPDKKPGDLYAAGQFELVKEAYETLTHPHKKSLYLQQRWYHQASGKKKYQGILTPVTILQQVLELDRYVSALDTHRMDKEGLYQHINELLDNEAITKLAAFNDVAVNEQVIGIMLRILNVLPYSRAESVTRKLEPVATERSANEIHLFLVRHRLSHRWDRYRIWIVLLIVLLLSLLIFFLG